MSVRALQVKYNLAIGLDKRSLLGYGFSPYLSLKELGYFFINSFEEQPELFEFLFQEFDLMEVGCDYEIPVVYILGENDYQTPSELAVEYFEQINTPYKNIHIIKDAGHSPYLDETTVFTEILMNELDAILTKE